MSSSKKAEGESAKPSLPSFFGWFSDIVPDTKRASISESQDKTDNTTTSYYVLQQRLKEKQKKEEEAEAELIVKRQSLLSSGGSRRSSLFLKEQRNSFVSKADTPVKDAGNKELSQSDESYDSDSDYNFYDTSSDESSDDELSRKLSSVNSNATGSLPQTQSIITQKSQNHTQNELQAKHSTSFSIPRAETFSATSSILFAQQEDNPCAPDVILQKAFLADAVGDIFAESLNEEEVSKSLATVASEKATGSSQSKESFPLASGTDNDKRTSDLLDKDVCDEPKDNVVWEKIINALNINEHDDALAKKHKVVLAHLPRNAIRSLPVLHPSGVEHEDEQSSLPFLNSTQNGENNNNAPLEAAVGDNDETKQDDSDSDSLFGCENVEAQQLKNLVKIDMVQSLSSIFMKSDDACDETVNENLTEEMNFLESTKRGSYHTLNASRELNETLQKPGTDKSDGLQEMNNTAFQTSYHIRSDSGNVDETLKKPSTDKNYDPKEMNEVAFKTIERLPVQMLPHLVSKHRSLENIRTSVTTDEVQRSPTLMSNLLQAFEPSQNSQEENKTNSEQSLPSPYGSEQDIPSDHKLLDASYTGSSPTTIEAKTVHGLVQSVPQITTDKDECLISEATTGKKKTKRPSIVDVERSAPTLTIFDLPSSNDDAEKTSREPQKLDKGKKKATLPPQSSQTNYSTVGPSFQKQKNTTAVMNDPVTTSVKYQTVGAKVPTSSKAVKTGPNLVALTELNDLPPSYSVIQGSAPIATAIMDSPVNSPVSANDKKQVTTFSRPYTRKVNPKQIGDDANEELLKRPSSRTRRRSDAERNRGRDLEEDRRLKRQTKRRGSYHDYRRNSKNNDAPKRLKDPKTRKEISEIKRYRPIFMITVSLVQFSVMIWISYLQYTRTKLPISMDPFNPMLGPSSAILIEVGARYIPCMRQTYYNYTHPVYSCPPGIASSSPPASSGSSSKLVDRYRRAVLNNTSTRGTSTSATEILSSFTPTSTKNSNGASPTTTTTPSYNPLPPDELSQCFLEDICRFGGFLSGKPDQGYRLLSANFIHGGWVHLITNLMFQWNTGRHIEQAYGWWRVALIYLLGGVGGFAFGAAFSNIQTRKPNLFGRCNTVVAAAGASGGLFALIACLFLDLILNFRLIPGPWKEIGRLISVAIIAFAIGLLPFIDNYAHIGGFIIGIFTGLIILPFKKVVKVMVLPMGLILFSLIFLSFYVFTNWASSCSWCKYLNCVPILGWCDQKS